MGLEVKSNINHIEEINALNREEIQNLSKLNKQLQPLMALPVELQEIYSKAPQRALYLNKAFDQLGENGVLEFVLELQAEDFLACLYTCADTRIENFKKVEDFSILSLVQDQNFVEMVLSRFMKLDFPNASKRALVIKEFFYLLSIERYAGAISLLYGQFEGLLTDFLVAKGLLRLNENNKLQYQGEKIEYKDQRNQNKKLATNTHVTGLTYKILIANHHFKEFHKLLIYRIDHHAHSYADSRNSILHGTDLDNFTLERAFILAMWFYLVCSWMEKAK